MHFSMFAVLTPSCWSNMAENNVPPASTSLLYPGRMTRDSRGVVQATTCYVTNCTFANLHEIQKYSVRSWKSWENCCSKKKRKVPLNKTEKKFSKRKMREEYPQRAWKYMSTSKQIGSSTQYSQLKSSCPSKEMALNHTMQLALPSPHDLVDLSSMIPWSKFCWTIFVKIC